MQVILFIVLIIGLIFLVGFFVKAILSKKLLLDAFKSNNVIVYGKKGKGKDLLFQYVINCRKKPYASNISYGGKYKHIELTDLELLPNTYENFINGSIEKIDKKMFFEKRDIYISDGGVYLPSQFDNKLHKLYPSMPITYALSRHLYSNNIHVNVQNLNRLWKALREQADRYVLCKSCIKIFDLFIIKFNVYDRYNTACLEYEPLKVKKKLIGRLDYSDTRDKEYKAVNGDIKSGFIIVPKKMVKYDTRAFEKIVFKNDCVNVLSRGRNHLKGKFSIKVYIKKLSLWVHRLFTRKKS